MQNSTSFLSNLELNFVDLPNDAAATSKPLFERRYYLLVGRHGSVIFLDLTGIIAFDVLREREQLVRRLGSRVPEVGRDGWWGSHKKSGNAPNNRKRV
ncbi:hypothetical protein [Mesorhizobium amorphae]|uniref:hypothetical protein n=1 Tax=Mesorhizobium amorphae TaxID=71433 RepID=UPI001182B256|nr:hypothetical protein [Mesorhizobium amorphae]